MSFRKKIILSQLISFILFLFFLVPIIDKIAPALVRESLLESTGDLKQELSQSNTEKELVFLLQRQQYFAFFQMILINEKGLVIYDTYQGRLLKEDFRPYSVGENREIQEARKKGIGYRIAPSETFGGKFAYVAETFPFQGKTYILYTAFPYNQIQDLTENFEIGIFILSTAILLFFNGLIWMIFHQLTKPIREITQAILPYQRGEQTELPEIKLTKSKTPTEEFHRLASAFNTLSRKIQEQIDDLKRERNEKEAILESLGEGVIAVNEKMIVLYINFIACKMLGLVRKQVLNKSFNASGEKVEQALLQRCQDLLRDCQSKGNFVTDSFSLGKDRKTYIDLIAAPKAQGTGAILVLQDKTTHYQVLEIGKDFVANASHELRTPITIIKGYAEALHDMPGLNRTQIAEITEKIGRNCDRMENLVTNLLTLADIENLPDSRFEETDLISLIENCIHTILSVQPKTSIDFVKGMEKIKISADPGLLELAFMNLLDNAVKYSPSPAQITIRLEMNGEEDVVIKVQDRGQGIPPEDLEHVFERFYRVDKTHSRKLGGAGLGLSIVKTIIGKHGGKISVTSTLGQGTTFTVILPSHASHHS